MPPENVARFSNQTPPNTSDPTDPHLLHSGDVEALQHHVEAMGVNGCLHPEVMQNMMDLTGSAPRSDLTGITHTHPAVPASCLVPEFFKSPISVVYYHNSRLKLMIF